jgi:uncharacterized protein YecT (DUF1311 family)
MTRPILFIAALLFSTPAFAHVEYSETYHTCMAQADHNVAMTECLSQEADRLEKQLEDAYTAAMARAIDYDQTNKEISPNLPELSQNVQNLQKSQEAFKTYLETECHRRMLLFGTGSGAGAEYAGCLAELRKHRIEELAGS